MILWASFIPYLTAQVYAAIKCRGRWRALALLPLVWMVPVGIVTANALRADSNMWPCMLIPTSLVSFVYLAALVVSRSSANESRGFEVVAKGKSDPFAEPSSAPAPEKTDI